MRKIIPLIILALTIIPLAPLSSNAQPPGDAAFKKVKLLKKRLNLSDEQADSIYSIFMKYDFKNCDKISSFTKKDQCFKRVRTTKNKEMKSVLSETQRAELEEFMAECAQNHGPKPKRPKRVDDAKASCSS